MNLGWGVEGYKYAVIFFLFFIFTSNLLPFFHFSGTVDT